MRPHSIVQFDRLFLVGMAISAVNTLLSWNDAVALLEGDPASASIGMGAGFLAAVTAFGFAISLLLWFLIARRASVVAKWILVVLTAIGLLSMLSSLPQLVERSVLSTLLPVAVMGIQLVAIACLFRSDAKAWFASKGTAGAESAIFE